MQLNTGEVSQMDVMIFFILLALIFGFILGFLIYKAVSKGEVLERAEEKAKEFFDRQKEELKASIERDYEARFENWKREAEKAIKKKTLETSRASLKGRIGEQMAPLLPIFEYNPADARFIGNPIDYVIFDRYTDVKDRNTDDQITIIFMDVKTGKSAYLNPTQKKIKEAVESGRINWKTLFLGDLSKFGENIPKQEGDIEENITKIAGIEPNKLCSIICKVDSIGVKNEFEGGKVAHVYISDDTGSIDVSLWDEYTDLVDRLSIGSLIKIENGYAKKSELSGEIELYVNRINRGNVTFLKNNVK